MMTVLDHYTSFVFNYNMGKGEKKQESSSYIPSSMLLTNQGQANNISASFTILEVLKHIKTQHFHFSHMN